MGCEPLSEITWGFISSQYPGGFLGIDNENKIELLDPIWVIEVMI